ncbi:FimV/HubP family polar landmark protein [Paraburkholderia xenovorans]|uniref:FimV/HubP family polar landmark protein n=1 Tax=Paraburkholderia xenovorans TaxID=36873 RepID=UPI0015C54C95|nr:FimV/HubP family polar landmark protein [Paraburkholderia xenovorans]NPT35079.1 fimbrial protein FimV [Paraburkholderia xenovorans]
MNLRLSSLRAMFVHQGAGQLMATAALAFALAGAGLGSAVAAPGDAASAPDAAAVSYANGGQVTVRAGQSLNDVAIAVTQSHDRATLARASRALFEANPNAFMSHDPSRMRVGAVLTVPVPVLDASGALAASSAGAASAVSATAATTPASAPGTAVASGPASGVAQVNAAAASAVSAASAAARAATPAAPAVAATASVAAEASSAAPAAVVSSAPLVGSQAAALPASGAHEWAGSIQPSASEPAEGASAPGTATTAGTSAAQPASQPRAQVSSLQQLLALKNRVLMELQKHGIGGTPAVTATAPTGVAQPAPGASSAAAAPGHVATPVASTSKDIGMSQTELSVAAAVGAALVVLLAALRMGRRKRERVAAAEAVSTEGDSAVSARVTGQQDIASTREEIPVHEAPDAADEAAVRNAAALAATEREAAEGEAAAREMAERVAAERDAEIRRAAAREAEEQAAERAAEERAAAERVAGEQATAERVAAEQAAAEHAAEERAAAERAVEEQAAAERAAEEQAAAKRATEQQTAAERAAEEQTATERAAAEHAATQQPASGHEATAHATFPTQDPATPQRVWQERDVTSSSVEPAQVDPNIAPSAQSDFAPEPLPAPPLDHFDDATMAASLAAAAELGAEALPLAPPEPLDEAFPHEGPVHRLQWDDEPAAPQEPLPEPAAPVHSQPAPTVPTEFPRDAVDAFGSLDMPLPPRVESSADHVHAPASLSTQPVSSQEATAKQSAAEHHPDDTPHIADEIAAGTAGHAAVAGLGAGLSTGLGAGLGASGFGALKLDFDLELPPGPAEPLPAFTQADLTRIARNKLDLATEYIELGDLSGARSLINEVIETNDPATRTEARALLSTLAPLS